MKFKVRFSDISRVFIQLGSFHILILTKYLTACKKFKCKLASLTRKTFYVLRSDNSSSSYDFARFYGLSLNIKLIYKKGKSLNYDILHTENPLYSG